MLNGLYFPAVDFLASVATAIVLGYGGWLVLEGDMTVGTLLAFTLYLSNFFDPVQQLSQLYNTFLSAIAALDRIVDVLDEEADVVDAPDAAALDRIHGDVRFEGCGSATARGPRCCTASTWTCRQGRPSPWSAIPVPGSRRSPSSSPASTTRAMGA